MTSQRARMGGLVELRISEMTSGNFIRDQSDDLSFQHLLLTTIKISHPTKFYFTVKSRHVLLMLI